MSEKPKRKALLLVGGFGTRLRPLTFTKAKPLIEFINKPILVHQIEALKKVGVDEIVLAINYNAEKMFSYLKEFEKEYQIKITVSKEDVPLGTAGPIGLAKNILKDAEDIFIFNADITCEFPLQEMFEFHKKHGKEGTIATTKVKDPSRFGVIVTDEKKKKFQTRLKTALRLSCQRGLQKRLNDKLLQRVKGDNNVANAEDAIKQSEKGNDGGNTLLGADAQVNPTDNTQTIKETKQVDLKSYMEKLKK